MWCNNVGFVLVVRICDWWNKCLMFIVLCVYWRFYWLVNFVLVIIEGVCVLWMGDLIERLVVYVIGRWFLDKLIYFVVVFSVWYYYFICIGFVGRWEFGIGLIIWLYCGSFLFSDSVENIIDFMKFFFNFCLFFGFFLWMVFNMLW